MAVKLNKLVKTLKKQEGLFPSCFVYIVQLVSHVGISSTVRGSGERPSRFPTR